MPFGAAGCADYHANWWGQIHLLSASGTPANRVDDRGVAPGRVDGKTRCRNSVSVGCLLRCCTANCPKQQRQQTLWAIEQQRLRLLYLSPETLLSEPVWERLCQPNLTINGLILDEAHCLVQWGDTFRPAYYRLGMVRPALLKCKPAGTTMAIAAFTATANPDAQQTIQRVLQLQQPEIFRLNPYRAQFAPQCTGGVDSEAATTANCLRLSRQDGGRLVWCMSARDAIVKRWQNGCRSRALSDRGIPCRVESG